MRLSSTILTAFALASLTTGCAATSQVPVREVAVDYSDYAAYDRQYSPSPHYGAIDYGTASTVRAQNAPGETVVAVDGTDGSPEPTCVSCTLVVVHVDK